MAASVVLRLSLAGLARPFAPVCSPPLGPLDQTRRMQLRLRPGVAPGKVVALAKVLVKLPHVPAPVKLPTKLKHPLQLPCRHPLRRGLAKPPVNQHLHIGLITARPPASII